MLCLPLKLDRRIFMIRKEKAAVGNWHSRKNFLLKDKLHKWRNQLQTRTSCGRFSHDTINPFRFRIYSLSLLQFPSLTATEIFMLEKKKKKIEKSLPSGSVDCVNRRWQSLTTFFLFLRNVAVEFSKGVEYS